MKPRKIIPQLRKAIKRADKKIIFLWGARQTGKSTILNSLYQELGGSYFNFENLDDQRLFIPELVKLEDSIKSKNTRPGSKNVFIDEIQQYPDSTQAIKLLADKGEHIIFATGSSELRAKTNRFDTLAGRYKEFVLFPLTIDEVTAFCDETVHFVKKPNHAQTQQLGRHLEEIMIYGSYPAVILTKDKIDELKNITQNSVIKDIVNIYDLKNTDLVYNLLRLLAMQIGNLINVTELASSLGTTKITIDNYLSILSKNRVIYLLEPFKTNKRKAYLGRKKVFFLDLGIRNTLVDDFRALNVRQDLGAVFENLIVVGALRQISYQRNNKRLFYFREIGGAQKEIDLIIETAAGEKSGYEIKYSGRELNKFPELGIVRYQTVSRYNAVDFLV